MGRAELSALLCNLWKGCGMIREYWINVYYYPPLEAIYYSHKFGSKAHAISASFNKMYGISKFYKTLYRIHVRLK